MLKVGQDQLQVDGLDVACRVNRAVHMDDVVVVKAAHNMDNGVDLADMGQELVAEAFALGRATHQAGDVHELHHGRRGLFGVIELGQRLQAGIGHGDHADVGVDGAERIVRALRARVGDGVKQGRFADVRQTHDS